MALRGLVIAAALATMGCPSPPAQGEIAVSTGDVDAFGDLVQPVIRDNCSSLDCHGDAARPMRLYALWGLRLDVTLRGEDESADELEANMLAIGAIDPGAKPEDNVVVLKPISTSVGGIKHEGGIIWSGTDDPAYVCLIAWLAGELPGNAAAEDACREAAPTP